LIQINIEKNIFREYLATTLTQRHAPRPTSFMTFHSSLHHRRGTVMACLFPSPGAAPATPLRYPS